MSMEFNEFAHEFNFKHTTSSPHFCQANCATEHYVGIAKSMLKEDDPDKACMLYLVTPHIATGTSPAQILFNKPMRIFIPSLPNYSQTRLNLALTHNKERVKKNYDRRHGVNSLLSLQKGDNVYTKLDHQNRWRPGAVTASFNEQRSYLVQTKNNAVFWRNREQPKDKNGKYFKLNNMF